MKCILTFSIKKKTYNFFSIIYIRFVHEFVASVNNNKNKTHQSVFAWRKFVFHVVEMKNNIKENYYTFWQNLYIFLCQLHYIITLKIDKQYTYKY